MTNMNPDSLRDRFAKLAQDGAHASREVTHWLGQQVRSGWRRARSPWKVDVEGAQHLPEGAAILAVNHLSSSDAMRLTGSLTRKVHIYQDQQRRGVRRTVSQSEAESEALAALTVGQLVGYFPEAEPSPDGDLHRGSPELARLALRARVPIVPAGFVTINDELGANLVLRIGRPVDISRQAGLPPLSPSLDMIVMQGITDEVMTQIAELTGQRYVDFQDADDDYRQLGLGDLQDEAESHFAQLRDEIADLEQQAFAEEQAEQDQLLAAVEAARRQAERADRRGQR